MGVSLKASLKLMLYSSTVRKCLRLSKRIAWQLQPSISRGYEKKMKNCLRILITGFALITSFSVHAAPPLGGTLNIQPFWFQKIHYNWSFKLNVANQVSVPLGTTSGPGFNISFFKTEALAPLNGDERVNAEERGIETEVCLTNHGNRTIEIRGLATSLTSLDHQERERIEPLDARQSPKESGGLGSIRPRQTKCFNLSFEDDDLVPGERYAERVRVSYDENRLESSFELTAVIQFPLLPKIETVDATAVFHGITKSPTPGFLITNFPESIVTEIKESGLQIAFQWTVKNLSVKCGSRQPLNFSAYLETSDTHKIIPDLRSTILTTGPCFENMSP